MANSLLLIGLVIHAPCRNGSTKYLKVAEFGRAYFQFRAMVNQFLTIKNKTGFIGKIGKFKTKLFLECRWQFYATDIEESSLIERYGFESHTPMALWVARGQAHGRQIFWARKACRVLWRRCANTCELRFIAPVSCRFIDAGITKIFRRMRGV